MNEARRSGRRNEARQSGRMKDEARLSGTRNDVRMTVKTPKNYPFRIRVYRESELPVDIISTEPGKAYKCNRRLTKEEMNSMFYMEITDIPQFQQGLVRLSTGNDDTVRMPNSYGVTFGMGSIPFEDDEFALRNFEKQVCSVKTVDSIISNFLSQEQYIKTSRPRDPIIFDYSVFETGIFASRASHTTLFLQNGTHTSGCFFTSIPRVNGRDCKEFLEEIKKKDPVLGENGYCNDPKCDIISVCTDDKLDSKDGISLIKRLEECGLMSKLYKRPTSDGSVTDGTWRCKDQLIYDIYRPRIMLQSKVDFKSDTDMSWLQNKEIAALPAECIAMYVLRMLENFLRKGHSENFTFGNKELKIENICLKLDPLSKQRARISKGRHSGHINGIAYLASPMASKSSSLKYFGKEKHNANAWSYAEGCREDWKSISTIAGVFLTTLSGLGFSKENTGGVLNMDKVYIKHQWEEICKKAMKIWSKVNGRISNYEKKEDLGKLYAAFITYLKPVYNIRVLKLTDVTNFLDKFESNDNPNPKEVYDGLKELLKQVY